MQDSSCRCWQRKVSASAGWCAASVVHPIIRTLDKHVQKVPVQEAVIGSGMDLTILRPSHFF